MLSIGLIPHFFILFSVSILFLKSHWLFPFDFFCARFCFSIFCKVHLYRFAFSSFFLIRLFLLFYRFSSNDWFTVTFFLPSVILLLIKIDIFLKAFLGSPSYVFGGLYLAFSDYGVIRYLPVGLYLLYLDYSFSMLNITGLYLRR